MTSHPPVLHFFMHMAFVCAAVKSDAFYIFVITCGKGKVLSRIFWKKAQPLFPKIPLRYEQNNLPIQQISMRKRWKDTHLILVQNKLAKQTCKRAKQTWSQSFTLHIQIARPWGRTFQSNSPLSGGQVSIKCPTSAPPPPLGLNIDRCIRTTVYRKPTHTDRLLD